MQRQTMSKKALIVVLLAVIGLALWWRGPVWLTALTPRTYQGSPFLPDFFQDWASAKNYLKGVPVYDPLENALARYLGQHRRPGDTVFTEVNAHPPASVLLTLPFALLGYQDAFVVWTELCLIMLGLSIWIVLCGLGFRLDLQTCLTIFLLLLFCHPLLSHMQQGQWMIPLLLLLSLSWHWERTGKPWLAGISLGIAAVLKLIPGFLFFPFLLRRRWRVVLGGAAGSLGLSLLTTVVLGWNATGTYFREVLPHVVRYRGACHNLSLCGIWYKLLAPLPHWMPVEFTRGWQTPATATAIWLAVSGLLVALLAWCIWNRGDDADVCLSLSIVAMLLVSPVTWDHYLVLLVLPLAVLWQRLPRHTAAWPAYLFCAAILWLEPLAVMQHGLILLGAARSPQTGHWLVGPLELLTAISVPTYALLGLFFLLLLAPTSAPLARSAAAANLVSDSLNASAEKRSMEHPSGVCEQVGGIASYLAQQELPPKGLQRHELSLIQICRKAAPKTPAQRRNWPISNCPASPTDVFAWLEFACWTLLVLAPILRWVNGPAVSSDQLVVRVALVLLAGTGAIVLRIINRRRKQPSSLATESNTQNSGENHTG
ncbi:glycosyltransferase family 87 protein [Thermopirellula anaerolimosa]